MKRCSKCKDEKPLDDFYRCARKADGRQVWCKTCQVDANRGYEKRNPELRRKQKRLAAAKQRALYPEKRKAQERKSRYGISPEHFDRLMEEQGGVCAICAQACMRELSVDHNHTTKKLRGLLCSPCNLGIGQFGDTAVRLRAAAAYLDHYDG